MTNTEDIQPVNRLAAPRSKVLFLGFGREKTKIIDLLIGADVEVWHSEDVIADTGGYDLVISFGYRHILTKTVIDNATCPILNLHISYLPYNKGAHPNFWAFFEETPSGVSIHEIDYGIDTGDLIYRREVQFDRRTQTFAETYEILNREVEALFIENFDEVLSNKFSSAPQVGKGSYHRMADLPNAFAGWDSNIETEIARLINAVKG